MLTIVSRYLGRNAVAVLALVVALGGASYAAVKLPPNSVGAAQIKTNAVRSAEVKNGSIGAAELGKVLTSRIRTTSSQQVNATSVNLTFHKVDENAGGFANLTNRPTALRATRTGVYLVQAEARWFDLPAVGRVNGSIVIRRPDGSHLRTAASEITPASGVQFLIQSVSATVRLQAGQQIGLSVYQDSGGSATIDGTDQGAWLSLTYLGK